MPYVNREIPSARREPLHYDSDDDPTPYDGFHSRNRARVRGRRYVSSGGACFDSDSAWDHETNNMIRRTRLSPSHREPFNVQNNNRGLQWLRRCEREHAEHCNSQNSWTKATAGGPVWLIDVAGLRIMPAEDGMKYAILSYVWGSGNHLKLTQTNCSVLQHQNALSKAPRTIRDAIKITGQDFNLKYLWVDSLCIMQDDQHHKAAQIAKMAEIYANAELTIVAAYGKHSDAGLRPLIYGSPWELSSGWLKGNLDSSNQSLYALKTQLLGPSPWMGRAWTLQELVFSRRAIIFTENLVFWECHCATWHNGTTTLTPGKQCFSRFSVSAHGLQHSPWPDLTEYSELVRNYSARDLTFQNDARAAFAGITTTYSKVFKDGFHFGLPEMFFDIALLWLPDSDLIPRDRESFPSWSWMGWRGSVDLAKWKDGFDYLAHGYHRSTSRTIIMIGKWHSGLSMDGPWSPLNVCRTMYHMGNHGTKRHADLPRGWSCNTTSDKPPSYHHTSDPKTEFRYPIPIVDPCASVSAQVPSPHHDAFYLRFRSTHAFFTIHTFSPFHQSGNNDSTRAAIINHGNIQVGTLQVNHSQDLADLSTAGGSSEKQEFVAISSIQHDTSKQAGSQIDSYHVLWVVRDETGCAQRRGLGEIWKRSWDRFAERKEVDIILR